MSAANPKFKDIDDYASKFSPEIQGVIQKLRQIIKDAAPDCDESISYDMPAFKLNGQYLTYFAVWKTHIGFYGTFGMESFKEELSEYESSGRGTVQFPFNKPFPYDLIRRIIEKRVAEIKTA